MPIYLQHGNLIDYVPPTDTSTEDVVFMGGLVGIPQTFIPAGELGALSVDGVYMFTKKDGVSVNLGEVVKYCGTTKLAQDSNADLTLGVAVADAEADSLGVKVKINSVLPTDGGGGGGGGGEIAVCNDSGLFVDDNGMIGIKFCGSSAINADESGVYLKTDINSGLTLDPYGNVAIRYCGSSAISADAGGVFLKVCTNSGLSIQGGQLVASGGGGGGGSIGLTENHSFIVTGCASPNDQGNVVNIGYCNKGGSRGSVMLGAFTDNCSASGAVVIGSYAKVNPYAQGGIAIGNYAEVAENGCGSIAIGLNAKSCSPNLSCGNIVIGDGINPYSDSALLVVSGNGSTGNSRQGILLYGNYSSFLETAGISQGAGIAYVTSTDRGASWTSQCSINF